MVWRLPWSWSYGSWICNYICNQCLSPLALWVWIPLMARCTQCNILWCSDKVCQRLVAGRWFSPGTPVSSNKTYCKDITEILLKVAWNAITLTLIHVNNSFRSKDMKIYPYNVSSFIYVRVWTTYYCMM